MRLAGNIKEFHTLEVICQKALLINCLGVVLIHILVPRNQGYS